MATYLYVTFRDADEAESVEGYRMALDLLPDGSNFAAIQTAAQNIVDDLKDMSSAAVVGHEIRATYVDIPPAGKPDEQSLVGTYAFIRMQDTNTSKNTAYQLPSPDKDVYDASKRGLLDQNFNDDWIAIMPNFVDWNTGAVLEFDYAQQRTRKRHQPNLG